VVPAEQAEVAAYLARLAGAAPIETHISAVFRGADTVWKLKKAVRLSFLDFSDRDARRHFTEREFALNAGAAPGLYRDVAAVIRRADGTLALVPAPADDATVVDWVLRMARVPDGQFLDEIAAQGALTEALQDELGDVVAAYHAGLAPLPGTDPATAMARVIDGNAEAARGAGLAGERVAAWQARVTGLLGQHAGTLRARAARGLVRRCHGDLHLGNLCRWGGKIVPFDALEFDEALASIDLGYDLAFLLMDLDQRAGRAAANRVMNRYLARTGDVEITRFLPMFLSCRALIKAHVVARSGAGNITRSGAGGRAQTYLAAALAYLQSPAAAIIAIGGLPGTGKSSLARALAPGLGRAPGAVVLRSDEIRKRLHNAAPEQRLPPAAYTEAVSTEVFATLAEQACQIAAGGQAVIADATFLDPAHRRQIAVAARNAGVAFRGIWLTAPLPVLEQRIAARTADASDATVAVLHAARQRDTGDLTWTNIDATDDAAAIRQAQEVLRSA